MNKKIVINTKNLKIRTLKPGDANSKYVKGLNDPDVNKFLDAVRKRHQTLATVKDFIQSNLKSKYSLLLGVFLDNSNELIGTIRLHDITFDHFLCYLGICFFRKKYWGRGYASEALREVVDFAFLKMKLNYIESGVYIGNNSSIKLFKKVGFTERTIYKNVYVHENKFRDVIIFGIKNSLFCLPEKN